MILSVHLGYGIPATVSEERRGPLAVVSVTSGWSGSCAPVFDDS